MTLHLAIAEHAEVNHSGNKHVKKQLKQFSHECEYNVKKKCPNILCLIECVTPASNSTM